MARILIVDDEPEMLKTLRELLEDEGFQTATASSGEAGVRTYQAVRPDAVLLDLSMPTMDGLSALVEIRRIDPKARVAMLTGVCTRAVVKEAITAGAQDFVLKPFDLDRVLSAVEGMLAA